MASMSLCQQLGTGSRFIFHVSVYCFCRSATQVFLAGCTLMGWIRGKQKPPPRRLPSPTAGSINDLMQKLPRVTLPKNILGHPVTLAFAPCANLCTYMFGAVACLQRSTNYEDLKPNLRCSGVSSGSLVAAAATLHTDAAELFSKALPLFEASCERRGGWIGVYSRIIREVARMAASGKAVQEATSGGRLRIGVTALDPLPFFHEVTEYKSSLDIQEAILASCSVPIVFEQTIWLPGLGPCLDGGASRFVVDGDFVFSPYKSSTPDLGPEKEYSRQLVFGTVHAEDMLRLFEDGYRDCARWVEAGCPSRKEERSKAIESTNNVSTLFKEGWDTLLEVTGIRVKPS